LAALGLAMRFNDLKAILSLDGSEMHYYGDSGQADSSFNTLRNSMSFGLSKSKMPYAYLESGSKQEERNTDSIFNILPLINVQKIYLRFPQTAHENFSCLLSLKPQGTEAENKNRQFYDQVKRFALNYFDNYLKHQSSGLSAQLSSIWQTHEADTLYPIANMGDQKALLVISGKIIDAKNSASIGYANIGVPGKNIGTVAQTDGTFIIKMKSDLKNDSLRVSIVGYQSRVFRIADLLNRHKGATILLFEKANELKEVVVSAQIGRKKKIGNSSTSKFISFGFPLKFLGSEIGIKISLGKKPVLLNDFSFTVSENRLDTAIFRLNIYNLKNGLPFENIMGQNVFAYVGKKPGTYRINLIQYNIRMKGDIFIALEWIQGASAIPKTGAIFLSAGLLSSSTWHRQTSEAEWKKFAAIGVGFNVSVQQLQR
ncbi:MAG TPA: carboxypeptidase-like regulatory domain-containing protein, partial [Puia sp.]|nr:carboxypeptidase-like regulatory domain-containing protein [Puia sp.]